MLAYDSVVASALYKLPDLMYIGSDTDGKICRTFYQSGPYHLITDIFDYLKELYNNQQIKVDIRIERLSCINGPILKHVDGFSLVYKDFVFRDYTETLYEMPSTMDRLTDEKFYEFTIRTWQSKNNMTLDAVMFLYDFITRSKKYTLSPQFYYNGELMDNSAGIFREYCKKKQNSTIAEYNALHFENCNEMMKIN